jgi:hypothetical protein
MHRPNEALRIQEVDSRLELVDPHNSAFRIDAPHATVGERTAHGLRVRDEIEFSQLTV